ncbi:MAG TPA: hypothetical protein VJL59_23630 [Anaerolineales bacterium]|nr:hypothetical protein [Anaerolineales bacterium]
MRRILFLLPFVLAACASGSSVPATQVVELPPPKVVERTSTPIPSDTPTQTLTPSATNTPTPTDTATAIATIVPSDTATAVASPRATRPPVTAAASPGVTVTVSVNSSPTSTLAPVAHVYSSPIIIANYLTWFDAGSWSTGCTSDSPAAGAYNSDDSSTIARHIVEAQTAGLDGFAVHWGGPGDRTDRNLSQVLSQGFGATVTFLNHFFYGVQSRSTVAANLSYVINTYTGSGSWIRYAGKPVIFFADMGRVDTSGGLKAVDAWKSIRDSVDPNHNTIWIAEGLDPSYLSVFDGLYVYKIDHACCQYAYQSVGKWAGWVRDAEKLYGPRYWVATIQPGWNDSLTVNEACNGVRVSSEPFARDREGGAYYQRTANSAFATTPDMIIVNSFNEWVEGSFIEPSAGFGDLYITLTAQYAQQFHSSR